MPKTRKAGSKPAACDPFPGFVEPCIPSARARAPEGARWIHEIKFDGYRTQVRNDGAKTSALTRRGYDWTQKLSPIVMAVAALPARTLIMDGETIVAGPDGTPDFAALHADLARGRIDRLRFYAFDLLYLDGEDLRPLAVIKRRAKLKDLLEAAPAQPVLQFSDHFDTAGSALFAHACKLGLEGIVSKRKDAPYRSGASASWIKSKCVNRDNFPIIAFVEKLDARPRRIASLYLGRRDGTRLLYAGKAQSGFKSEDLFMLRERLDPYIRKTSPLSEPIKKPKATWVEPVVEAEIAFNSVTAEGVLRAPVFKAVREDISPGPGAALPVSSPRAPAQHLKIGRVPRENILQLLPDAVAPSEAELKAYWKKAGARALIHLARRPLKLVRRVGDVVFYHKGPLPPVPPSVHEIRIEKREGGQGRRVWVDDIEGLLGLVAMGAVELHPWNATIDDLERPDMLVFDLDPGEGVSWTFVTDAALALRRLLEDEKLQCWPKLTGGKGVHVMAPITPDIDHDQARAYARMISNRLAKTAPSRFTLRSDPAARTDRIFIDYLRNGRGTTAIGAFSPRARPGAPIAAPVSWRMIERGRGPGAYSIKRPPRGMVSS